MAWWMAIPAIIKAGTSAYDIYQSRQREKELKGAQRRYEAGLEETAKVGIDPKERRAYIRSVVGETRREVLPEAGRLGFEERARRARALGPGAAQSLSLAAPTKAETEALRIVGKTRERAAERIELMSEEEKRRAKQELGRARLEFAGQRGAARAATTRAITGAIGDIASVAPAIAGAIDRGEFELPEDFENLSKGELYEFGKRKGFSEEEIDQLLDIQEMMLGR